MSESAEKVTPASLKPASQPIDPWMIAVATGRAPPPTSTTRIPGVDSSWFGPMQPLSPMAEQAKGRRLDYPTGYNLWTQPKVYEGVNFRQLRNLADSHDITRILIEQRKDEIQRQPWHFMMKDEDADKKATAKNPHVKALTQFFKSPDNEHSFEIWQRQILEDMLVIDAISLYKRPTNAGGLYGIEVFDGGTFKLLIDADGRRPLPPAPAYQQVLKGLPAVDFSSEEIIYWQRNPRSNKFYGFSPVEWIVLTINIALRREVSQLQYYTDGNIPDAIIGAPADWSIDQIQRLQAYWDSQIDGDTGARRHARFVPGNFKFQQTRDPTLKDEIDEWLARVACAAFRVPPTPFIKQMNRATADNAKESAEEQGIIPELTNFTALMNWIIEDAFGFDDVEFKFQDDVETDPQVQANVDKIYCDAGIKSVDEVRDSLGLPPIGMPNAVITATGPVLLEQFIEEAEVSHTNKMTRLNAGQTATPPPPQFAAQPQLGPDGKPLPGQQPPAQESQNAPQIQAKPDEGKKPPPKADPGADKTAGKIAKRIGGKIMKPHPHDRKVTNGAIRILKRTVGRFLQKQAKVVGDAIGAHLGKMLKAEDESEPMSLETATAEASKIVAEIELTGWAVLGDDMIPVLANVHKDGSLQAIQTVGVDAGKDYFSQASKDAGDFAAKRAAELVGTKAEKADAELLSATRDKVKPMVIQALQEGWSKKKLADNLRGSAAFSAQRANLIAQTEVARADGIGSMDGYRKSGVVQGKVWLLSGDHDVPDECLIGGTLVKSGPFSRAFSRRYIGPLVEIEIADGHRLTGTPNHPVLTDIGDWKPLNQIQKGDRLISGTFIESMASATNYFDEVESTLKDKFTSLCGRTSTVPTSAGDFHGDGIGSHVHTIATYSLLHGKFRAFMNQFVKTFFGFGVKFSPAFAEYWNSCMCSFDPGHSLFAAGMGSPQSLCIAAGTQSISVSAQSTDNSNTTNSKTLTDFNRGKLIIKIKSGKLLETASCAIVVNIRHFVDSVDVFNLTTDCGFFIADGIVTCNCDDNADDGTIALGDTFSSGDDTYPAHPGCECTVAPIVKSG